MELTMTTAINTAATSERELTIDELDAVSGGGTNGGNVASGWNLTHNTIVGGGGDIGGGGADPAIAAWNKLLGNYGF
jgi:uncharacterized membrane protein YgcG